MKTEIKQLDSEFSLKSVPNKLFVEDLLELDGATLFIP